jgi:hypothetical protein
MNHKNKSFKDERVELGDDRFHNCVFTNCELVFDGHRSPTFSDNEFIESVFVFTEHAVRTLYFLSNIYHAGDGGHQVIEQTFQDVRDCAFHGREVRTIAPRTVDHSLH